MSSCVLLCLGFDVGKENLDNWRLTCKAAEKQRSPASPVDSGFVYHVESENTPHSVDQPATRHVCRHTKCTHAEQSMVSGEESVRHWNGVESTMFERPVR